MDHGTLVRSEFARGSWQKQLGRDERRPRVRVVCGSVETVGQNVRDIRAEAEPDLFELAVIVVGRLSNPATWQT